MLKNISWSRGFIRLWIVYGFIVVISTGMFIYNEKPFMPSQILLYSSKTDNFRVIKSYSSQEDWFNGAVESGKISEYKIGSDTLGFSKTIAEKIKELKISEYRKEYQALYDSKLQEERIDVFMFGLGFLVVPLIIGLSIKWILMGFRSKKTADIPPSGNNQEG